MFKQKVKIAARTETSAAARSRFNSNLVYKGPRNGGENLRGCCAGSCPSPVMSYGPEPRRTPNPTALRSRGHRGVPLRPPLPQNRQRHGCADSKSPDSFDGKLITAALFTSSVCSVYRHHSASVGLSLSPGAGKL